MTRDPATALLDRIASLLGPAAVVRDAERLAVYARDGSSMGNVRPRAVVFPRDTADVATIVRACHAARVPFVARGAGTGLSGGAMALDGGIVVAMNRMDRILSLDAVDRAAVVQPGVRNLAVSEAAAPHGLLYAPDPSSQAVCTIGGNVAHNSGGPHTLKHGVTTNHVLGLTWVTPAGDVLSAAHGDPGYDLPALLTGGEGTLGIVTEVTLRLVRRPESVATLLAAFASLEAACEATSAIIAAGIVPAALEILDAEVVAALHAAFGLCFPDGARALLLVECDGPLPGMDDEVRAVNALLTSHGALSVRTAASDAERAELWRARKQAFGALGRIARHYSTQDGVIPRTQLPRMLASVRAIAARHGLRVANVFHAGDGNLHPCILFDADDAETLATVRRAGAEILAECVALGGTLTGEHGVGVEKRNGMKLLFAPDDLAVMARLRAAFDPDGLCNPGKILPGGAACGELSVLARQVAS